MIPTVFDDVQTGHAQFNFEHVGDTYFLSAVETPIGTYSLTIPRIGDQTRPDGTPGRVSFWKQLN